MHDDGRGLEVHWGLSATSSAPSQHELPTLIGLSAGEPTLSSSSNEASHKINGIGLVAMSHTSHGFTIAT